MHFSPRKIIHKFLWFTHFSCILTGICILQGGSTESFRYNRKSYENLNRNCHCKRFFSHAKQLPATKIGFGDLTKSQTLLLQEGFSFNNTFTHTQIVSYKHNSFCLPTALEIYKPFHKRFCILQQQVYFLFIAQLLFSCTCFIISLALTSLQTELRPTF